MESVSLPRALADVESLIEPQARTAGLTVAYSCAPDLVARADGEKLNQIIVNLVVTP
jgi:signal transduction histidine kinase